MTSTPAAAAKSKPTEETSVKNSVRETIESIVIAFVLAFLFRTFEAEAFVIPTGSMAPTLMGRHKDVECPVCHFPYRVGDVGEGEEHVPLLNWTCPNCRYETSYLGHDGPKPPPTYNGDRIIVTKFIYDFADPKRWDVSVFKYPALAKTNFIKRIVGLPHETLLIKSGNIYTGPEGAQNPNQFVLQRKPPDKVLAMLQTVYDNDYVVPWMLDRGFPPHWESDPAGSWQTLEDGRSFQTSGDAPHDVWLRYQNVLTPPQLWKPMQEGPLMATLREEVELSYIKDFNPYNTGIGSDERNIVGDLAVECELTVEKPQGQVMLELVQAQRRYRCTIDLATGQATLSAEDDPDFHPQAETSIRQPGSYDLRFSDVDDQLLLWVDNRLVNFNESTAYDRPMERRFGPADLNPVWIGSQRAAVRIDHLRVLRDVFYIAAKTRGGSAESISEIPEGVTFSLGEDQYLALGDNSARSKDSRLWTTRDEAGGMEYYVHRDMFIGKAMFIYWPHSLDHIPGTRIPFPFFPNLKRMKLIR